MSEWKKTTLGKISNKISYGYTESANNKPVGPKFLRITDIANGRLQWDKVPYCPISKVNFEKYALKTGDIVIARTGATTGATYTIKTNDPKNVVFASYLIRYQIDQTLADPFFIDFILKSNYWNGFIDGIKGGSAQPGANAKQFASFEIKLPPLPEQKAIAEVLGSLDDKIDLLHRQNKTLEQMAETLFRQWFVEDNDKNWKYGELKNYVKVVDNRGKTPPNTKDKTPYPLIEVNALGKMRDMLLPKLMSGKVMVETRINVETHGRASLQQQPTMQPTTQPTTTTHDTTHGRASLQQQPTMQPKK